MRKIFTAIIAVEDKYRIFKLFNWFGIFTMDDAI